MHVWIGGEMSASRHWQMLHFVDSTISKCHRDIDELTVNPSMITS